MLGCKPIGKMLILPDAWDYSGRVALWNSLAPTLRRVAAVPANQRGEKRPGGCLTWPGRTYIRK